MQRPPARGGGRLSRGDDGILFYFLFYFGVNGAVNEHGNGCETVVDF